MNTQKLQFYALESCSAYWSIIISNRPLTYPPTRLNTSYQNNNEHYFVLKELNEFHLAVFLSISGLIQDHLEGSKATKNLKHYDNLVQMIFF